MDRYTVDSIETEIKRKFAKNFIRDFDRRREGGENVANALVNATAYAQALLSDPERESLISLIRKEAQ